MASLSFPLFCDLLLVFVVFVSFFFFLENQYHVLKNHVFIGQSGVESMFEALGVSEKLGANIDW